MSDEDVKKALEFCRRDDYEHCEVCPYLKNKPCQENLIRDCFDFINRQQAEIDDLKRDTVPKLQDSLNRANKYGRATDRENARLKAEIERLKTDLKTMENVIKNSFLVKAGFDIDLLVEFKSEAIKEFAERLRKEVANTWFGVCCTGETEEYKEGCLHGLVAKQKHCIGAIDNLLAEMVGEQDV